MTLEILPNCTSSIDVNGEVGSKITTLQQVRNCALGKNNLLQALDCQVQIGQMFYEHGHPVEAQDAFEIALSELGGIKSSEESTQAWLEGQGKQVIGLLEELKEKLVVPEITPVCS